MDWKTNFQTHRKVILLLATASFVRLIMSRLPLINGEAYYARGALDLQWSYFDQPPMFFWLSGLCVKIFGYNNFALRLPSILLFAGTSILMYKLCLKVYKKIDVAFLATFLLNISAVFTFSIGFFYQPDGALIFFWMASFYLIYTLLFETENGTDAKQILAKFVLLGVLLGCTALSKYHVVFLGFGLLFFVLIHPKHRFWFRHYGFYLSILIAIILFLPVVYWNEQNDWISFVFQSRRAEASQTELRWDWLIRSLGGQALWVLPWIWLPMLAHIFYLFKAAKYKSYHLLIALVALPTIIFFTLVTLWSDLQFHFHWQAPGYLMLFMPLAFVLDSFKNRWIKGILNIGAVCSLVVYMILALHLETGFWTKYGPRWLANQFGENEDPTIFVHDFDEIKAKFEEHKWLEDTNYFAGATRWWLSGLVDYSLKAKKEFVIFSDDPRNYAFYGNPNLLLGKNCIVVSNQSYKNLIYKDVSPFFEKISLEDSCWIERYKGEKAMKVYFYKGINFQNSNLPQPHLPIYAQLNGKKPFDLLMDSSYSTEQNMWAVTKTKNSLHAVTTFESPKPLLRPKNIIKNKAFTGNYSCMVTNKMPFSYFMEQVCPAKPHSIRMKCKVFSTHNLSNLRWVTALDTIQNKATFNYQALPILYDTSHKGQWQEVDLSTHFEGDLLDNYLMQSYFWKVKEDSNTYYIDDLEFFVEFEK